MPDTSKEFHAGAVTAATSDDPWTTRRLLVWMSDHFKAKAIDSPRVTAEMLLSHVIGCERMRLYMEVDRPASSSELARLRELVVRAANHEPVQYLTNSAWFFGREFEVDRSTLIPRPCTETLVEEVLRQETLERQDVMTSNEDDVSLELAVAAAPPVLNDPLLIADIGTGTGCIAITLAAQLKGAKVVATDVVPEALELARRNAERHGVAERIEFIPGDGLGALENSRFAGRRFDVICSNPPYISDVEWETEVDRNVKEYEPASALRGGAEGLDVIEPLVQGAAKWLQPGGGLFLEIGYKQLERVIDLVNSTRDLEDAKGVKDHEGLWRVVVARRK